MPNVDVVLFEVIDRVALITVNDQTGATPSRQRCLPQLRAAVDRAEADHGVHAVVVTGAGRAFCAGADLSALGGAAEEGLLQLYDGFMAIGGCTLPTIAAVNGAAVGAGLNLALAADVRIAGPRALFDPRFQKLGLHPGWRHVDAQPSRWSTGRPRGPVCLARVSTPRPRSVTGLALCVADDPVAAALEMAAGPASAPREVVLDTKATMRATASPGDFDIDLHERAKQTELGPQATSIRSPEFAARLAAAQRS